MYLIQYEQDNARHVGVVQGNEVEKVNVVSSVRDLALMAIRASSTLAQVVQQLGCQAAPSLSDLVTAKRLLPPLDHEDPAHCLVSGTGLTHLGSAATRDNMHQEKETASEMTDTMRMFQWGVKGGKPAPGQVGAQPEWFYKGDGSIIARPGDDFLVPTFAEDYGEEPELAGLYVISDDGTPFRIGYAVGNEFSDHVMEKRNYLYLAHSKLRQCAFGPMLRVGDLPGHLEGISRILRNGQVLWEKVFLSGEDNMCHSLENLEYHHFKYRQFLRPGDVHVHFFGTATLSFADGIRTQPGDQFEIAIPEFGLPLVNGIKLEDANVQPGLVKSL